jgi:hypothetical protein
MLALLCTVHVYLMILIWLKHGPCDVGVFIRHQNVPVIPVNRIGIDRTLYSDSNLIDLALLPQTLSRFRWICCDVDCVHAW